MLFFPILACLWQLRAEAFYVQKPIGQFVTLREHRNKFLPLSTKYPTISSVYSSEIKPIYSHPHPLSQSSVLTADLVENATNVLVGIGGVVTVLAILTFVLATYVAPTAARQIEDLAKQLDPELWREYEQKLEPGESLVMRPELMQELGTKVIELQSKLDNDAVQKWDPAKRRAAEVDSVTSSEVVPEVPIMTTTSETTKKSPKEGSIDVEVVSKNRWDD